MINKWFARKNVFKGKNFLLVFLLFISFVLPVSALAEPTSAEQAQRIVQYWLYLDQKPLEAELGTEVIDVETFNNDEGVPLYHVVYLNPEGFVIVSGDDLVEPIIGFIPKGTEYDASLDYPLGALVSQDVPGRVNSARAIEAEIKSKGLDLSTRESLQSAHLKWAQLDQDVPDVPLESGVASISDVRVPPFVQSHWGQTTESGGNNCYNLYTPNYYPAGCVATAMSQIMRFHQYPTTSIGTASYTIYVNGVAQSRSLRGGDGSGGPYNWAYMDYGPTVSVLSHRQAIAALTHDTGVSVNMDYSATGSGTDTLKISDSFKNLYGYSNSVKGYNSGSNILTANRNKMVNPNLDAGYPVAFGITGTSGGHAIVGDGYGYNSSTLYHHLNMGWSGSQDAWYNLPNIDDAYYGFTSVYKCVYNIFTSGSGEIISGRVTDSGGNPISGANVTAVRSGGGTYYATTNSKGIYAFKKVPSSSSYTISVVKTGHTFSNKYTSTSTSSDYSTVGNVWGVNFVSSVTPPPASSNKWPLYLAAINSGNSGTPTSYWGAGLGVCCDSSSTTFSLASFGVTKKSYAAGCSSTPSWEGWVTTTPGTKSFSWTLTSPTCGSYYGSFNYSLLNGKAYYFQPEVDGSNIVIYVYIYNASSSEAFSSSTEAGGGEMKTTSEITSSLQRVGKISLDIPKGIFEGSSCKTTDQ